MTLAESYGVLGLVAGADKNSIREAYRRLAKQYHPDINSSKDAQEKFILIKTAYDRLINTTETDLKQAGRPITKAEYYEKLYKEKVKVRSSTKTPSGNAYTGYGSYQNQKGKKDGKGQSPIYHMSRYFAFVLIALTLDVFIERNFIMFIALSFICLPSAYYLLKWAKTIN